MKKLKANFINKCVVMKDGKEIPCTILATHNNHAWVKYTNFASEMPVTVHIQQLRS